MTNYIIRRILLLPVTLFFIILITFVIINLAPGEPTTITEISPEGGATRRENGALAFGTDDRYLQFREHYGLTLPILLNFWPWTSKETVESTLQQLMHPEKMSVKEYDHLRIRFGDRARFIMPELLHIMEDKSNSLELRQMALRFFVRGGTQQAHVGANLTKEQRKYNRKVAEDNQFLRSVTLEDLPKIRQWYNENKEQYRWDPSLTQKLGMLFETRITRYFSQVLTLNFGTLRNDNTKTVISEVSKRFKYSLTLALLPMLLSFFFCQIFGFIMAFRHNRWPDYTLNLLFLFLYAIPIFVVTPFLIEKIALNHTFPFTDIPIPYSGFTSPESQYSLMTSSERLFDVIRHILLPIIAIMYGTLAASSRLSRTAVLEVLKQDYVRTAHAKGLPSGRILFKHVGRNAAITIVTSIAGSLGIVLGGSLIVETLFEINGFGKFFYDAIINRDYNVIMFSALAGSFLSLIGYLVADITYTVLDPRVTLE